nr:methyl-accepting chemotaxis protein [Azoarcus sp. KH32C]
MAIIVALSALIFHGNATSTEALREVYEENVIPLQHIREIHDLLGEIRFRIAGVITDQMPAPGSRRHLAEASEALPKLWTAYRQQSMAAPDGSEEHELTGTLEAGIAKLPALFRKLDESYAAANDKELLTGILEEDWPVVITGVSKPLAALIDLRTQQVEKVYRHAELKEQHFNRIAIGLVVAAVTLLTMFTAWIIRSITASLGEIRHALDCVARGDLTAKATARGSDELGEMAGAINHTLATLCETMSHVRESSDRVAGASGHVRQSAADIRTRAETQSGEVMKLTAAMQQLTVSVAEISSGSTQVSDAAARAQRAAESGEQLMRESRATTDRAQLAAARSSDAVSALSASIQQISAISTVIREIADQTNLLALNAAIEAARAGEAGRGFAVVADEVRKLAERTGHSTAEIGAIIHAVEEQADSAVSAMREVDSDVEEDMRTIVRLETAFGEILAAARQVSTLAGGIAHSTREQQLVADQTASGMETISQAVEHTSTTIGMMAGAADESAKSADILRQVVGRFRTA